MLLKRPISAQLEVTYNCNHKCTYCYNYWRCDKNSSLGDSDEQIETYLRHLTDAEVFNVTLTGGEPFLRKDLTYRLIEQAKKVGTGIGLNTNLTLMKGDDFKKLKDLGMKSISTSFCSSDEQAFREITNNSKAYHTFLRNLENLFSTGIDANVNMVVIQRNKNQVYETGRFLHKNFGVQKFSATPVVPADYHGKGIILTKEELQDSIDQLVRLHDDYGMNVDILEALPKCVIKEEYKSRNLPFLKRSCSAGRTSLAVSATGDVRPCTHASKVYGNLKEKSLGAIWEDMSAWRDDSIIPEGCRSCSELNFCNGGCRVSSHSNCGEWDREDIYMQDPLKNAPVYKKETLFPVISNNQELKIGSDIKTREEGEDFFLMGSSSGRSTFFINGEFHKLIQVFKREESFSIENFAEKYGLNQEHLRRIVSYLHSKNIIGGIKNGK